MAQNVLITGASSGIGKALAHTFAENGHNLILSSSIDKKLAEAAEEISSRHPNISVTHFVQDLTSMDGPEKLYKQVQDAGLQVDILVNDAGVGFRSLFAEMPMEKIDEIVHLNIRALVTLTRLYLPEMLARNSGKILNVGSIAGFQPGPLMAVYHATKAFVVSFSDSITEEIKDSNVTLTVLCPGPVNTSFFEYAGADDARAHDPSLLMEPTEVAEAAFRGLMDGEHTVVPGMMNKTLVFSRRLMSREMQAKLNKKAYESSEE